MRQRLRRNSIDTIITDPPYGINFMGKEWDYDIPSIKCFKRMLRVAKPGATLLCFGGTRTFHRIACNIEDAGWQIKDCIMWLYGQGFPKSHNISKAIDKAKGKKRKVIGTNPNARPKSHLGKESSAGNIGYKVFPYSPITAPASNTAKQWDGWGTGLKPALEPIIVAMKPAEGTFAQNAEKYGVAGLNIDGGRIPCLGGSPSRQRRKKYIPPQNKTYPGGWETTTRKGYNDPREGEKQGRWPANIILDKKSAEMLDYQTGELQGASRFFKVLEPEPCFFCGYTEERGNHQVGPHVFLCDECLLQGRTLDLPNRFLYCAKASKRERNLGLEKIKPKQRDLTRKKGKPGGDNPRNRGVILIQNSHPTVKPLKLMEYLCTLTKTPTGGLVLDPFMGTGTTGMACKLTGRHFIGIELDKEYCRISKLRIKATKRIKPKNEIPKEKIFKV